MLYNDKYLPKLSFPILHDQYSWISTVRIQNFMPRVQKYYLIQVTRALNISAGLTTNEVLIGAIVVSLDQREMVELVASCEMDKV